MSENSVDEALEWADCNTGRTRTAAGNCAVTLAAEVRRLRAELAEATAPGWRDYYDEMKNLKERLSRAERVVVSAAFVEESYRPGGHDLYDSMSNLRRSISAYRAVKP